MDDNFRRAALDYHRLPRPGKLAVVPTKRMATQRDLALAYSPGVAAACEEISANVDTARDYTARGNLVGVITNGTAVLGLGNIGPLASKPVMEGKAVLFKKFADIDVFDIEVDAQDPQAFIDVVAALEPTFGAINLEDIKAPECFMIERELRARMRIPVFHDDQHGTAIVVRRRRHQRPAAAGQAAVRRPAGHLGRRCGGAGLRRPAGGDGAAARERDAHRREGRGLCRPRRRHGRQHGPLRARHRCADAGRGAARRRRVPGPVGAARAEGRTGCARWRRTPFILALANPEPEIQPDLARAVRPDAIIATGRSDYPNQVNNVLCFPFIFRGALDCGAREINEAMKVAAVEAIAELARIEASEAVAAAYGGEAPVFGPEYIIPKPFDPRLILVVAPAVARAAMESGVAERPIADFEAYRQDLDDVVYRSGQVMRPVFEAARKAPHRIAYAEGEDERTLRAVQSVVDDRIARPVLLGRRQVIEGKLRSLGLRLDLDHDAEVIDPDTSDLFEPLVGEYQRLVGRRGMPLEAASRALRRRPTIAAAMLLRAGLVDAAVVGGLNSWSQQVRYVLPVIPPREAANRVYALTALIQDNGVLFFCDTHMVLDPTAEQLCEMTLLAADAVRMFGITPRAALLSHSNFGSSDHPSPRKVRRALALIRAAAPDLEVDGEMQADTALSEALRTRTVPDSTLTGSANLLIMPTLDAANISYSLLKAAAEGLQVGPILLGVSRPVHVLTQSVTARGIANLTALIGAQLAAASHDAAHAAHAAKPKVAPAVLHEAPPAAAVGAPPEATHQAATPEAVS